MLPLYYIDPERPRAGSGGREQIVDVAVGKNYFFLPPEKNRSTLLTTLSLAPNFPLIAV
jgi:hypothetical protein